MDERLATVQIMHVTSCLSAELRVHDAILACSPIEHDHYAYSMGNPRTW